MSDYRRLHSIAFLAAGCAMLLCVSARSADDAKEGLKSALEEMNAIEARIERLLGDQAAKKEEIKALDRDAKMARELLISGDRTRERGRRTIDQLTVENQRELRVLEEATLSGKRQLEEAKSGIVLSAPLLLQAERTRGADPASLTLALVHLRQRRQAKLAVEQLLKIEEVKSARLKSRDRIEEFSQRYAALAGMKIEDLRKRHRDLSRQLTYLTAAAENADTSVVQLSERRNSLNELIARLSRGEPAPKEIAAPAPAVSPPTRARSTTPDDGDLPEIENEDQNHLALGTREGNGAATVRLEIDQGAGLNGEANRHWRASPTTIHALASGKVLFGGAFAGYRHLLVIDHDGGWVSVYGNLTQCDLAEGQSVEASQMLGHYDPEAMHKREPFWIEVRQDARPVPIETMPAAGTNWEARVYDGAKT